MSGDPGEEKYVVINIWAPRNINGTFVGYDAHISMETRSDYVDFLPEKNKDIMFFKRNKSNELLNQNQKGFRMDYATDCVFNAISAGNFYVISKVSELMPQQKAYIYNINENSYRPYAQSESLNYEIERLIAVTPTEASVRLVMYSLHVDGLVEEFNGLHVNSRGWRLWSENGLIPSRDTLPENAYSLAHYCLRSGGMHKQSGEIIKHWELVDSFEGLMNEVLSFKNYEIAQYPKTSYWHCPMINKEAESDPEKITKLYNLGQESHRVRFNPFSILKNNSEYRQGQHALTFSGRVYRTMQVFNGDMDNLGILDYIFVIPLAAKLLFSSTKSVFWSAATHIFSLPKNVLSFCIGLVLSPIALIVQLIFNIEYEGEINKIKSLHVDVEVLGENRSTHELVRNRLLSSVIALDDNKKLAGFFGQNLITIREHSHGDRLAAEIGLCSGRDLNYQIDGKPLRSISVPFCRENAEGMRAILKIGAFFSKKQDGLSVKVSELLSQEGLRM